MRFMDEFQQNGTPHIIAMVVTILLPVILSVSVRKAKSEKLTQSICYLLAAVLIVNEIIIWIYRIMDEGARMFIQEGLPLEICGLAVFMTVFVLIKRNQYVYETAYLWGMAGTLQAIISPEITGGSIPHQPGFPHYLFFQYFVGHSGIVGGILFATWGLKMRPSAHSILRTFVITNLYMVCILGVNVLFNYIFMHELRPVEGGSNYLFLCRKPETNSVFLFLDWPYYLLFFEVLGLAFFFILYAPFFISDVIKNGRENKLIAGSD
ncbi:TPA: TIGR02206 family membrane protein [Candidatus Poribacteria bacterium]|nr:TIGR02206 family membrane protein [Candidatus Poribacteria bacterium]HIA65145.1 TIGR02206 family membrane protein [Candidatus Poribacteria bacterium]HIC02196.1 TIGR02206 family membrane protein [Candidatus Poribacteria bacterium]HIN30899.1 TIGR02206 family membrane protein [Candidatus Poribacteria bacterium]HIO07062.1 TIGR02206 family membrane protein [Candidatus Poribacteria bacterium]